MNRPHEKSLSPVLLLFIIITVSLGKFRMLLLYLLPAENPPNAPDSVVVNTQIQDKSATHTGTHWDCCKDLPFSDYLYMYICSYHYCPWKPGFVAPAVGPALSRIRNKLHRGYALAMVTPPKRCCGSALSPWLPINPSNVVGFLQICSSLTTFRCRIDVLRSCSTVCFYFNCLNSPKQLLSTMEPLKFLFTCSPA